jgi:hypothetical protein
MTSKEANLSMFTVVVALTLGITIGALWGIFITEDEAVARGYGRMVPKGRKSVFVWKEMGEFNQAVKIKTIPGQTLTVSGYLTIDGTEIEIHEVSEDK